MQNNPQGSSSKGSRPSANPGTAASQHQGRHSVRGAEGVARQEGNRGDVAARRVSQVESDERNEGEGEQAKTKEIESVQAKLEIIAKRLDEKAFEEKHHQFLIQNYEGYLKKKRSEIENKYKVLGEEYEVPGTELQPQIIFFDQKVKCLSTFALNVAAVVAIVSNKAAILAHIPPWEDYLNGALVTEDHESTKRVTTQAMIYAIDLYHKFDQTHFAPKDDVWAAMILPTKGGKLLLEGVAQSIKTGLLERKFSRGVVMHMYEVQYHFDGDSPKLSTFFVDGRTLPAKCWLNDREFGRPSTRNPPKNEPPE